MAEITACESTRPRSSAACAIGEKAASQAADNAKTDRFEKMTNTRAPVQTVMAALRYCELPFVKAG